MDKHLDNVDLVLRLTLSAAVILCRLLGIITGPIANILVGLAMVLILLFVGRVLFSWMLSD